MRLLCHVLAPKRELVTQVSTQLYIHAFCHCFYCIAQRRKIITLVHEKTKQGVFNDKTCNFIPLMYDIYWLFNTTSKVLYRFVRGTYHHHENKEKGKYFFNWKVRTTRNPVDTRYVFLGYFIFISCCVCRVILIYYILFKYRTMWYILAHVHR